MTSVRISSVRHLHDSAKEQARQPHAACSQNHTRVVGNQAHLRRLAVGGQPLQAKLTIGAVNDPLEHEADAAADRVMRMADPQMVQVTDPAVLQRKCTACEEEDQPVRRKAAGADMAGETAPAIVANVLRAPGSTLDPATRRFMASRFGADFSDVRIHTDARAAQSAAAVGAHAYTVGRNIVFGAGQFDPASGNGRHLLAHELAHVVQQSSGVARLSLQRFEASEVTRIAVTPKAMLDQIRLLIDESTSHDNLDWDHFVEISGGSSAGREMDKKLGSPDPTIKSKLLTRYLFTCRCGLLDMRHYLQLLYISDYARGISGSEAQGNRAATGNGRKHELTAEARSQFGAEDTPSNALGAATTFRLAGLPSPDGVYTAIADTLNNCGPVGWSSLSPPSQQQIIHFYGDAADPASPSSVPKNQNQTAVPDILPVTECQGKERSFPYALEDDDSDRKSLSSNTFIGGSTTQTSASDIRDFVFTQRPEIISSLPLSEKMRFLNKLMKWPIRDSDRDAMEIIYHNSTGAERVAEP